MVHMNWEPCSGTKVDKFRNNKKKINKTKLKTYASYEFFEEDVEVNSVYEFLFYFH